MLKVIAEQEHYLLISDGRRFTVVEKRAGKFYPLRTGVRHGLDLDDGSVAEIRQSGSYSERDAVPFWLKLHLSGAICSNTSDEADDVPSGTGPPVTSHPILICTRLPIAL